MGLSNKRCSDIIIVYSVKWKEADFYVDERKEKQTECRHYAQVFCRLSVCVRHKQQIILEK